MLGLLSAVTACVAVEMAGIQQARIGKSSIK